MSDHNFILEEEVGLAKYFVSNLWETNRFNSQRKINKKYLSSKNWLTNQCNKIGKSGF